MTPRAWSVVSVVVLASGLQCALAAAAALTWREVVYDAQSDAIPARSNFGMGYDGARNQIIVFGGSGSAGLLDDTWVFDVATRRWSELAVPLKPAARFSFLSGVDQQGGRDRFLIALGEGEGRAFFNDVWALDLATHEWSEVVTTGTPPEPRYGSAGGVVPGSGQWFMVSHGFSTRRFSNTFGLRLSDDTWVAKTPLSGDVPFARCLHSGIALPAGRMAIATGCGSGGYGPCPAADAWHLQSATWVKAERSCVGPRTYSSMVQFPDSDTTAIVFGGQGWIWGSGDAGVVSVWDTTSGQWDRVLPAATGALPAVRRSANMVRTHGPANQGNAVYMFGGQSDRYLSDMWVLEGNSTAGLESLSCPVWFDLRIVHGVLMFLAWAVFLPAGVTIARFGRAAGWFPWHRGLQVSGVCLSTAGLAVAILMVGAGKFAAVPHSIIGLVVAVIGLQQPANACCRPHPEPRTIKRIAFEVWHKNVGRLGVVLGLINPFWGFFYLDGRTVGPWFVLYCVWVSGIAAFWVVGTLIGLPGDEHPGGASWIAARVGCLRKTSCGRHLRLRVCHVRAGEAKLDPTSTGPRPTNTDRRGSRGSAGGEPRARHRSTNPADSTGGRAVELT